MFPIKASICLAYLYFQIRCYLTDISLIINENTFLLSVFTIALAFDGLFSSIAESYNDEQSGMAFFKEYRNALKSMKDSVYGSKSITNANK
jgi:hypothetical protein